MNSYLIGKFPMEIADLINFDIDAINLDETSISSLNHFVYIFLKIGGWIIDTEEVRDRTIDNLNNEGYRINWTPLLLRNK